LETRQRDSEVYGDLDDQRRRDQEFLARFGYKQELDRSLGFFSTFAIAFGFVSATNGFFALFYYALDVGGPAGVFWTWPVVVLGQLMVALTFAEAASHYPLAGGVYQWAKHLMGGSYSWLVAWMFLFALLVTVAGVAFGAAPIVCSLLGWEATRWTLFRVALFFSLLPMVLNIWGVRIMAFINNIGTVAEMVGMTGLGLVLLAVVMFANHTHAGIGVLVDTAGTGAGHSWGYVGAFLAAMITPVWVMYGFDTAGALAEETLNPSKEVPRAIIAGVLITAVVSTIWLLGILLAIPNVKQAIAQGPRVLPWLLHYHLPFVVADGFLVVVLTAIFICSLSVQASATRLLFALSRDGMIPDNRYLSAVSARTRTPVRAAVSVAVFAVGVLLFQDQLSSVIAWATAGVYVVYQMVVFATMHARAHGWPSTKAAFSLGRWGWAVNVLAFAYGISMICNLAWPRSPGRPWYDNYLVLYSLAIIAASGLVVAAVMRAKGADLSGGLQDLGPTAPVAPSGKNETEP